MRYQQGFLAKIVLSAIFLLIIGFIGWEFYNLNDSTVKSSFISYLSGYSSFCVSVLTLAYVITNSLQLRVNSNQLDEMIKARLFANQPNLTFSKVLFNIEKPRAYATPSNGCFQYKGIPRSHCYAKIENFSDSAAIGCIVSCQIQYLEKQSKKIIGTIDEYIEILSKGIEDKSEFNCTYLFSENIINLIEVLRKRDFNYIPQIVFKVVFKNVLGGAFCIEKVYSVIAKQDDFKVLENWHSESIIFDTRYQDNINKLIKTSDANWDDEFEKLKSDFNSRLINIKELEIELVPKKGAYSLRTISIEDYDKLSSMGYYGKFIPSWHEGCLFEDINEMKAGK